MNNNQCCYNIEEKMGNTIASSQCIYKPNQKDGKKKKCQLIDKNTNMICIDQFTFNIRDYLKKDLVIFYKYFTPLSLQNTKSSSKKAVFYEIVKTIIQKLHSYHSELPNIIKYQSLYRGYIEREKYKDKMRSCNNNEDFFTFESIQDIESKYFFICKDKMKIRWGFDIRSLHRLMQHNFVNPYTRESFTDEIKNAIELRIKQLQKTGNEIDHIDTLQRNKEEIIKQQVVDLFSKIELSGYSCSIPWFLDLSLDKLKRLYKELEDIWNFRAHLSIDMKKEIAPPNGRLFTTNPIEVYTYTNKQELQNLLLHEIIKMTSSNIESTKTLGFMYFLVGLSQVSRECYLTHLSWISIV